MKQFKFTITFIVMIIVACLISCSKPTIKDLEAKHGPLTRVIPVKFEFVHYQDTTGEVHDYIRKGDRFTYLSSWTPKGDKQVRRIK